MMRLFFGLLLGLCLAGCGAKEAPSADEAKAAFDGYVQALNDGDVNAAAAIYDDGPDFHWIERGTIQYQSGKEAGNSLKSIAKGGGKSRMTIDQTKIAMLSEGSALLSTHFDYAMLSSTGEQQFAFDGWMTVGMVKRAEGWRIAGGQTGPGVVEEQADPDGETQ